MSTSEATLKEGGQEKPADKGADKPKIVYGRNGVPIIPRGSESGKQFRTYEIYQRERVGESTAKIKPMQLISPEYRKDPYPLLEILRENYPCYRDWVSNCYWITRYDDVTSIFTDDANFETRPKQWFYDIEGFGRDLRQELAVLFAVADRTDEYAPEVLDTIIAGFATKGEVDLATEFAARLPLELLGRILDLPPDDLPEFARRYWTMQRGYYWEPVTREAGLKAMDELVEYFTPLLEDRRKNPGDDLISAIGGLDLEGGPATANDLVATLLEGDHQTLHGGMANMLFLLLTHPDQLHEVSHTRRLVKFAWLETLRHSTPVISAKRFARHEVERFGRLLPEGGILECAAAAGNRDPRVYHDPDQFMVKRKDLCQREPRGMYRADGLPAGIAFGLGQPSKHPALPEDRPRSVYALTRDTAALALNKLLDACPNMRLQPHAPHPELKSLRLGEMHTCWHLPVEFDAS